MKARNKAKLNIIKGTIPHLASRFRILILKKPFKPYIKLLIFFSVLILTMGIFYINNSDVKSEINTSVDDNASERVKLDKVDASKVTFSTITPDGKSIESLGGWTRINPPSADYLVIAYADKIDLVNIKVSQQALPDDFIDQNSSKVQDLALSYGASQKISSGTNNIYIGTSSNKEQSLIFVKENTLILIKSEGIISNNSWLQYIDALK